MELRQIEYFLEVASREHMTDAAEVLHVAQSSISRQISQLEKELGVELFIREGRRVRLTHIGKIFYERMLQVTNLINEAKRETKEFLDPEKGTIRIAFPISMASYTLPSMIRGFRGIYPDAKFEMDNAPYDQLILGVEKGDYNLAMLAPMPKNIQQYKVHGQTLYDEPIVALLPTQHPLAKKSEIHLQELQGDPFILLPQGTIFRKQVMEACKQAGFTPNSTLEGRDIDALKGLVSAGLGITLMPEMTLIGNTPRSTKIIRLANPNLFRTVGIIHPSQRDILPTEKLFYDFLIKTYERLNEFKE